MGRIGQVVIALAAAVVVGLLGASAFNPQAGFLFHSFVLWRFFGITFEVGLPVFGSVAILAAFTTMITSRGENPET